MATTTALKSSQKESTKQTIPSAQDTQDTDDELGSVEEAESDNDSDKDEVEEELERLVFGDKAGFRVGLSNFSLQDIGEEDNDETVVTGLEGLDDADLFFTDLAPTDNVHQPSALDTTGGARRQPAWEDSDDERLMISLASVPRLRKLRRYEGEDIINGTEYSNRLREQYERLNPTPQWALDAMKKSARKRRKLSHGSDSSDSDANMDVDEDGQSVAPLAELLRSAESLVRESNTGVGRKRKLRSETINIERQRDIDMIQPSAITSMSFHPELPLLLTSGPSSTLYLHHLSPSPPAPTPNPLLTSFHVRGSHLTTTAFHPSDPRIFLSSRRRYFHIWNLNTGRIEKINRVAGHEHEQKTMEIFKLSPDGKYMALLGTSKKNTGTVNILDAASLRWSSMVRIDSRGGVTDFAWWRNGKGLSVASRSGEITEWDIEQQKFIARWQDEGAVGVTTISLGGRHEFQQSAIGPDRWVAVGSSSGIVNIYDRREWLSSSAKQNISDEVDLVPSNPKPTRMLDNLTTPVTQLVFSPDGQILAVASKWSRDAMRLVHLPSCTVFKNWPTSGTPLGRITAIAFAGGEVVEGDDELHSVLAVANEQGRIRLWYIR